MKVSIVVPVYNISDYLPECLESIAHQSFEDFEVILVDDGSADGSGAICDSICEEDGRFTCIHQDNAGVSVARNAGIDASSGDLISFVDGDDILHPHYLERLVTALEDSGAAMCLCGHTRFSTKPAFQVMESESPVAISGHQALIRMLYADGLDDSPCGSVIERSAWGQCRFPMGIEYEDLYLMPLVYSRLDSVAIVPDALYGYRQRQGSAMNAARPSKKRLEDYESAIAHLMELPGYGADGALTRAVDARRCLESLRLRRYIKLSDHEEASSERLTGLNKVCGRLARGVLADHSSPRRLKLKCLALWMAPRLSARLASRMKGVEK